MLVPVDSSEISEKILDTAVCTAKRLNAEVHLLAIVPETEHGTALSGPTWYPSYANEIWPGDQPSMDVLVESRNQAMQATRQQAESHLRLLSARFDGLPVRRTVLPGRSVGQAVIDYARDSEIDLIAMATHGRRRLAQALLGSVAAEVVHSGVAPCLLLKPPDDR